MRVHSMSRWEDWVIIRLRALTWAIAITAWLLHPSFLEGRQQSSSPRSDTDVRVEQSIRDLQDSNRQVRERAVGELRESKDPRAVLPLLAVLNDRSIRGLATGALERIVRDLRESKDPRAVEPLVAALDRSEFQIRDAAASSLERIAKTLGASGDSTAVEPLVVLLKSPTRRSPPTPSMPWES
jgi:HEAT repeat protein